MTLEHYEEALEVHQQAGYQQGVMISLRQMGSVYYKKGEPTKALEYFGRALALAKEIGDKVGQANILNDIGGVHYNVYGDIEKTRTYVGQALKLHRETGYKPGKAFALYHMGAVCRAEGDADEALKLFTEAKALFESIGRSQESARIQGDIEGLMLEGTERVQQ